MQSDMFGRYHVTEPRRFYDGSAKWLVSPDPGSGRSRATSRPTRRRRRRSATSASNQPQAATSTGRRIDPYYLYLKLPGRRLRSTSSSSSRSCRCRRATASDRPGRRSSPPNSDPAQYGKLAVVRDAAGPDRRSARCRSNNQISSTQAISQRSRCLNQQGSQVIQGSLQLIPVGNSIVYVRPFYVQGRAAGLSRSSSSSSCSPRATARSAARRCRTALNQMLGRGQPVTTCNVSPGPQSGGTGTGRPRPRRPRPPPRPPGSTTTTAPPTTTTIPPATGTVAGPAQPGRGQARPGPDRARRPATSASTRRLVDRGPDAGEAGPAEAGGRQRARLDGPGLGIPPRDCYYRGSGNPRQPLRGAVRLGIRSR